MADSQNIKAILVVDVFRITCFLIGGGYSVSYDFATKRPILMSKCRISVPHFRKNSLIDTF